MLNYSNFNLNLSNLRNNINIIKNHTGKNVLFCAMVKANAYAHGLKNICQALKGQADFFGVATLGEAKAIRKFNKSTPVLIVSLINLKNVNWCAKNNVSITVNSVEEIEFINKTLTVKNLKLHFKINTGLNRIGFVNGNKFLKAYHLALKNPRIICEGIFTHFATKSADENFIKMQYNKFETFLNLIDYSKLIVHCCNSYAAMKFPEFHHNMVRCGFAIYGWSNYGEFNFKPVLTIKSKIIAIHNIKQGETVGYDRRFVADRKMKVGVVAIGYADGFDRRNSNLAQVIVNNSRAKVLGNICMDVCMVDLTRCKNVNKNDDVLILGGDRGSKNNFISTNYYAKLLQTSEYEILLKFNYNRMNVNLIEKSESGD